MQNADDMGARVGASVAAFIAADCSYEAAAETSGIPRTTIRDHVRIARREWPHLVPDPNDSFQKRKLEDDRAFLDIWSKAAGNPNATAALLNITTRRVYQLRCDVLLRRPEWENRLAIGLERCIDWPIPKRLDVEARGCTVLLGSDLHAWPGPVPPMWHAFCAVSHELQPEMTFLVGDVLDGCRASRHARTPFLTTPKITEEIDTARQWMSWLHPSPKKYLIEGNHDIRVDTYLANMAPELDDYAGRLSDRFSDWTFAWSAFLGPKVEVRHRYNGGIHTARNNTLNSGVTMVTGDTHRCIVTPHQDRNGVRWGVELGMLADPDHPAFSYNEGKPSQHRAGFAVLTFEDDGTLRPPELCEWHDGRAWFRGQVYADARSR